MYAHVEEDKGHDDVIHVTLVAGEEHNWDSPLDVKGLSTCMSLHVVHTDLLGLREHGHVSLGHLYSVEQSPEHIQQGPGHQSEGYKY